MPKPERTKRKTVLYAGIYFYGQSYVQAVDQQKTTEKNKLRGQKQWTKPNKRPKYRQNRVMHHKERRIIILILFISTRAYCRLGRNQGSTITAAKGEQIRELGKTQYAVHRYVHKRKRTALEDAIHHAQSTRGMSQCNMPPCYFITLPCLCTTYTYATAVPAL